MPNISAFGTQTDNAVVQGTVTDRQMIIPEVPPQGLMSVGPRVTPNFIKEPWNKLNSYNFFDVVKDSAGASYIAIKPVVPTNTELTNEEFWFKWSDPDAKFDQLQEVVKTYNERIRQNASAITAEVARAKAAEQAEEQRATAAEATKAPTNHASEETVYGIGNELNYGHVRLAADDTPLTSDSNAGIAATPKMIKTALDEKIDKTELVVIGDSWSDQKNAPAAVWVNIVASALGLNPHNYSQGGIGDNLSGLIDKFKADQTFDKSKIKYVIFMAGVNVNITQTSATAAKWTGFINEIEALVPADTKIYWFMNNFVKFTNAENPSGANIKTILDYNGYQAMLIRTINGNTRRCMFIQMISWFKSSMFDNTGYHLKESYQRNTLAPNICKVLNGAPVQTDSIYSYRVNVANKFQALVNGYLVGSSFVIEISLEGIGGQSTSSSFNETVELPFFFGYPISDVEITMKGKPVYASITIDDGNAKLNVKTNDAITFDKTIRASATYMRAPV